MRFSLVTLLLFSIWCGAALGVWFRREAWVFERFEPDNIDFNISITVAADANPCPSPDAGRSVREEAAHSPLNPFACSGFLILEMPSKKELYFQDCNPVVVNVSHPRFWTDDQIYIKGYCTGEAQFGRAYYRRRFPEWWWGHFYRPEVWAFALLSIALIARGIQALRRRRLARAV